MKKRIISAGLVAALLCSLFAGGKLTKNVAEVKRSEVKHFTAFFTTMGSELDEDNDIEAKIAELIGADCDETWLIGQTKEGALNSYIASGEYPDFISGDKMLYEADALIPIDEYWDDYPNIRDYLTDDEWDKFRQSDGHIYWIPQFGVGNGKCNELIHEGEAFWIQTRVLKWDNYPQIHTVDEYFDLIERYQAANPTMEDGKANIPFTLLCDDWRYFCLENVPQFLDGYPNDGCCMVDPTTHQVLDYNTTDTAKRYFAKLNEEYHKGILDPEAFTSSYQEYLNKLSTGAVLGMVDQWWDFYYAILSAYNPQSLNEQGCNYVPLPITMDEGTKNQWHIERAAELDNSGGISITVSCKDIEGAMKFMNDLLDSDIIRLRFWGEENVDYQVDENGLYYQTAEQSKGAVSAERQTDHYCSYSYFPRKEGYLSDGINAFTPEYQPHEFMRMQPEDVRECFAAYGCENYVDMLGNNESPGEWYPMYSYSTTLSESTEAGKAWMKMAEVKHTWLPQVVMTLDFDATWDIYMQEYKDSNPEVFLAGAQKELERRMQ